MGGRGWAGLAGVAVLGALLTGACGDGKRTVPEEQHPAELPSVETPVPTQVLPDASVSPAPDAGQEAAPDAGETTPDAGTPTTPDAGPWPAEPLKDYTRDFGVGTPQSAALDEALNLWLLDGERIGVLRPQDAAPKWTSRIGQARDGFGLSALATGSTVICGGEAGRAYVGYRTYGLQPTIPGRPHAYIPSPGEPYYTPERYAEYQKGDVDAVRLQPDGSVALEEHLWRTIGLSNKDRALGIHNTNNFHYDEDRTVYACQRVTRGPLRGDVYISTNHGVTRIQGLTYNSHRHPGWYNYVQLPDGTLDPQLQTPAVQGLGISPSGDVLVANEQMVGILVPSPKLEEWDRENTWDGPTPWTFKTFNGSLNPLAQDDLWRGFEQTAGGQYYLASAEYGLWSVVVKTRSAGEWTRVKGLPTERLLALKATDDGALYVGTDGAGLWRLERDGQTLAAVAGISGKRVRQLVYEPAVTPSMLLVVTEAGLTVLRGP